MTLTISVIMGMCESGNLDTHLFYKKKTAFQTMARCRGDAATVIRH